MNKLIVLLSAAACLTFATATIAVELPEEILRCQAIADPLERAECYDAAVDALQQPVQTPQAAAAPAPAPLPQPTPSIAPTLEVTAAPEPETIEITEPVSLPVAEAPAAPVSADPEAEVVELKQQVAELEQQVAVLTTEKEAEPLSSEDLFGKDDTETRKSLMEMFGLGGDVEQIQATLAEIKRSPYGKLVMVLDNGQIWAQSDSSRLNLKEGDGVVIKAAMLGSFLLEKQTGSLSIRVKRID